MLMITLFAISLIIHSEELSASLISGRVSTSTPVKGPVMSYMRGNGWELPDAETCTELEWDQMPTSIPCRRQDGGF